MSENAKHQEVARELGQRYEVLKNLGDCRVATGQYDQAREDYRQAAELGKDFPGHQAGLACIELLQGRTEAARQAFDAVAKAYPGCAEAWWGMAMACGKLGRYPEAIAHYRKCLSLQADNGLALRGLFDACLRFDRMEGVEPLLEAHLQKHPGDLEVLLCKARLQMKLGQSKDAGQTLSTIVALDPSMAQAHELLAQLKAR